jgi:MerR family regulatory protein/STAS-like domain of unknown function (DUF4325)
VSSESDHLVKVGDVARELGLSPSRVRQLADQGLIPSSRSAGSHRLFDLAAVRAAIARRTLPDQSGVVDALGRPNWHRTLTLLGLAEHDVWRKVVDDLHLDVKSPAGKIVACAFNEMLNNAIDHSGSDSADISWWVSDESWRFEISDRGIGVYRKLLDGLRLESEFEAVQELSKGKRTTDPTRHTGEGIFFTSKMVDFFRLVSSGVSWTVDNLRNDVALGIAPGAVGTTVICQVDPQTDRRVADVYKQFTEDFAFVRTRPVVKLFEIGTSFVSRSEARRLLEGLETGFEVVEVDFNQVDDVGQGFVDELLRVWPSMNPGVEVIPVNMNPAVEFMVKRGLRR